MIRRMHRKNAILFSIRFITICVLLVIVSFGSGGASLDHTIASGILSLDQSWRFHRGGAPGTENPDFDDTTWRLLDVPHDWSIENLPPRKESPDQELPVVTGSWRFQKGDDMTWKTVEIVDERGTIVPTSEIPIRFTVTGAGELAATGSAAPNDASRFQQPLRRTWQKRCLAILRPKGYAGKITLKAEADGLPAATEVVKTQ